LVLEASHLIIPKTFTKGYTSQSRNITKDGNRIQSTRKVQPRNILPETDQHVPDHIIRLIS